jgi:hypothetical protein
MYKRIGFKSEREFDENILACHATVKDHTENAEFKTKRKVRRQTVEKRTTNEVCIYRWLLYVYAYVYHMHVCSSEMYMYWRTNKNSMKENIT